MEPQDLIDKIENFSLVKKCLKGTAFVGTENEIVICKNDLDEILDWFNEIRDKYGINKCEKQK